jgi:hypothetical protein
MPGLHYSCATENLLISAVKLQEFRKKAEGLQHIPCFFALGSQPAEFLVSHLDDLEKEFEQHLSAFLLERRRVSRTKGGPC